MVAILIHGSVLYISYLVTYLLNDWLEQGMLPILIFSGIFVFGYLTIWIVIYCITKKNTEAVNQALNQKQRNSEGSSC
jgi:cytochrome c oxidase assembly factor CtaG